MILVTGSSGFIGGSIKKYLHYVLAPSKKELNLLDIESVDRYFEENTIDIIIHCATTNHTQFSAIDSPHWDFYPRFRADLEIFFNLARTGKKMIYFGSGAEYRPDEYGSAKGIMNDYTRLTKHIYNLRLYGCFGDGELDSRFITTCIERKRIGGEITIYADKLFDYVYMKDLCRVIDLFLSRTPKKQDYTIVGNEMYTLSQIADVVGVKWNRVGWGDNYCGNGEDFKKEFGFKFTPLEKAIEEYEASWTANVQAD